jgi:hypothetical protein
LSTGHLSFVRSMRQRMPRSMPGQRPGTVGRGPPPQSEHRRQSISSLRSLRFAAWSLAVPLARGPERSASSLLRLRHRQVPSVSATVALDWRPLHARRAVLHDLDAALPGRLRRGRCACPPPPLASRAHRWLWPHRRPLRVCRAGAFISPTAFEQARGGALGAGGGRVGFAGGGLF